MPKILVRIHAGFAVAQKFNYRKRSRLEIWRYF
jgi:hypothetical protein